MNNPQSTSPLLRFRVGIFTLVGLLLIAAITVFVNDKPYWWKKCNLVHINVNDATGLRMKSPVRSLGLQIGYIHSVRLAETHVRLGICLTAPVEVTDTTRAYIRPEGFLGDQFVELKPVRYVGGQDSASSSWWEFLVPMAHAENVSEVPMGKSNENISVVVKKVDVLVEQLSDLATNLKGALDPAELKTTVRELNKTLANAAKTLSPESGLTSTAQRTLAKLEDSIEQLRQVMTRINQGEGSIGKVINDPVYADELKLALKNLNALLSKASGMRLVIDVGGAQLASYNGARGWLSVAIWPTRSRYYLLGAAVDPRGLITLSTTTTQVGGASTTVRTTQIEESGILITAMLGVVLWDRLDFGIGLRFGDGAIRSAFRLGRRGDEEQIQLINEVYARQIGTGAGNSIADRLYGLVFPSRSKYLKILYLTGGLDSFKRNDGRVDYFYGAGVSFDDNDIKLLFSLL